MNKQKQQAPTGFMVVHPKHGTIMAGNDLNQLVKLAGAVLRRKVLAEVSFVVLPPSPEDGLITGSMWVDGDRSSVLAEVADLETIDQVATRLKKRPTEVLIKVLAWEERPADTTLKTMLTPDQVKRLENDLTCEDVLKGMRSPHRQPNLQPLRPGRGLGGLVVD